MNKLSSLTTQDKIKLTAELDGWTPDYKDSNGDWQGLHISKGRGFIPLYATSYDAIIPLIQKQSLEIKSKIETYIVCQSLCPMSILQTPSQLLDALLVATGKAEL